VANLDPNPRPLYRLVEIVNRLLGPGGCPWDQAQTHETLKKYLLEETYEVLEAIDREDLPNLQEELGDLLLQPIMHAQMERLAGTFDIDDVAKSICDKLVRRHPHVFGDVEAKDAETVLKNWDAIKKSEKVSGADSILSGIPASMPSLLRAHEISKRAARSGFEWERLSDVFEKLHEEEAELLAAIESGDRVEIESELGDLLFTAVNIARWCQVEPEQALGRMLSRFSSRFAAMETAGSVPLSELSPEAWNILWEKAKAREP
jgi:tetrapyrrole methylase family protein/MazG family protein